MDGSFKLNYMAKSVSFAIFEPIQSVAFERNTSTRCQCVAENRLQNSNVLDTI